MTVLGPGRRAGIWFQGCTIRCAGCVAVDTWRADPGTAVPVAEVIGWLESIPEAQLDGVTVSGGEPTDQPDALAAVLAGVEALRRRRGGDPFDVLVFSGREPEWVEGLGRHLFTGADAVMAGPYVEALAGTSLLRGSDNQRLVPLTDLGTHRFTDDRLPPRQRLQVEADDEGLWMMGIPLPGVMAGLVRGAHDAGLVLRGRSWST
ncbi:MAG: 4Fe-4S cluster-binding domain-containing protein [Kineosporiaceae bacterium]|nr:4Fe-4S cluster-binding domain-containing protein [Kineosporiaceae bacterium]